MASSQKSYGFLCVLMVLFFCLSAMLWGAGYTGYINQGTTYSSRFFDWILQPSEGTARNPVFIMMIAGVSSLMFLVLLIVYIVKKKRA